MLQGLNVFYLGFCELDGRGIEVMGVGGCEEDIVWVFVVLVGGEQEFSGQWFLGLL